MLFYILANNDAQIQHDIANGIHRRHKPDFFLIFWIMYDEID